jgi:DNA replication protein DnaC
MDANLKTLLKEYEQKRNLAEVKASQKKQELYTKIPELAKLEEDSNIYALDSIIKSLNSGNTDKSLAKNLKSNTTKKNQILKENGYDIHYLEPEYECKKCNDTGYIGSELCPCIKQKLYNIAYNNSNIYDLENQNFDKFVLDYYSDESDKEQYGTKVSPRKNIEKILKTCHNFVDNFDDVKTNNLLFCGATGLGKTFLSSCIANEMIKKGKVVLYQTAPLMLDQIIDYKFGKSNNNVFDAILNADLLIIDDLGTETVNSLKSTEIFNIINSRILNQNNKVTKTIISTNLSLDSLNSVYEERITSRLIGNYDCCLFYGDDIRIQKKLKK